MKMTTKVLALSFSMGLLTLMAATAPAAVSVAVGIGAPFTPVQPWGWPYGPGRGYYAPAPHYHPHRYSGYSNPAPVVAVVPSPLYITPDPVVVTAPPEEPTQDLSAIDQELYRVRAALNDRYGQNLLNGAQYSQMNARLSAIDESVHAQAYDGGGFLTASQEQTAFNQLQLLDRQIE